MTPDNTKNGNGKDSGKAGERIAKRMARAGLCSRRDAEAWIGEGRVKVNGQVLTSPACVVTDADTIEVDGKPLKPAERTRMFLYHKPAGLVTTARDEKGRKTVFETLPPGMGRVVSVGRLDINTEGLLLLTNDGALARHLELPATGWVRHYRVRVNGTVDEGKLAALKNGITVEGIHYKSIDAKLDSSKGANAWLTLSLREGKNREVRRVMGALGLTVNRLIRTAYGPFTLGDLTKGSVQEVRTDDLHKKIPAFFGEKK
jgi:23S rRNA pseudouridine2605 synthase